MGRNGLSIICRPYRRLNFLEWNGCVLVPSYALECSLWHGQCPLLQGVTLKRESPVTADHHVLLGLTVKLHPVKMPRRIPSITTLPRLACLPLCVCVVLLGAVDDAKMSPYMGFPLPEDHCEKVGTIKSTPILGTCSRQQARTLSNIPGSYEY